MSHTRRKRRFWRRKPPYSEAKRQGKVGVKRRTKGECEASMRAFDALPDTFRQFCAAHGRTTNGQALAQILAAFEGNERDAARFLADQLPVFDTLGEEITA